MIARVTHQHSKYAWWLWPNILSLDAPIVTLVWQLWFAKCFQVSLQSDYYLILFLIVWLIYGLDRWLDAWKLDINKPHSSRHRFYVDYRWPLAGLWMVMLMISTFILARLSGQVIIRGLWVLLGCIIYFLLVHKFNWKSLPKEVLVGIMVSLGVTLCFWTVGFEMVLPALCFAWLVILNCLVIGVGEKVFDRAQQYRSMTLYINTGYLGQRALKLAFAGLLLPILILSRGNPFYLPLLFSTLGLWALYQFQGSLTPALRRVLADAILLSPFLIYFVV